MTRTETDAGSALGNDELSRRVGPYEKQQEYRHGRAMTNMIAWYAQQFLLVAVGAATTLGGVDGWNPRSIGLLGIGTMVLAGVASFLDLKERWIRYRWSAETLRTLLRKLQTSATVTEKEFARFKRDCEAVIQTELEGWRDSANRLRQDHTNQTG